MGGEGTVKRNQRMEEGGGGGGHRARGRERQEQQHRERRATLGVTLNL